MVYIDCEQMEPIKPVLVIPSKSDYDVQNKWHQSGEYNSASDHDGTVEDTKLIFACLQRQKREISELN
jgi:hypothetical protein